MAVRTKSEIETQITQLLPDNTTGMISAADVRSVFTDLIDSLAFLTDVPGSGAHTRYFGWSADQEIETADLATANTSEQDTGVLPATGANGYVYAAFPEDEGLPKELRIGDNALFGSPFTRQAGTIDDANGDPHIVIVTNLEQVAALGEQAIELRY